LKPQTEPEPAAVVESAAVRLLAGREHSRQELARKLAIRGYPAGLIDRVLDDLARRRLLSDERFAELYIAQRSRKGYGPLRIRAELAERGVAGELASGWLAKADVDWDGLLADLALRRFGEGPAADQRELGRRGRFLEQRGFPIALVRRYLDQSRPA
jgi:regulatory protein